MREDESRNIDRDKRGLSQAKTTGILSLFEESTDLNIA